MGHLHVRGPYVSTVRLARKQRNKETGGERQRASSAKAPKFQPPVDQYLLMLEEEEEEYLLVQPFISENLISSYFARSSLRRDFIRIQFLKYVRCTN